MYLNTSTYICTVDILYFNSCLRLDKLFENVHPFLVGIWKTVFVGSPPLTRLRCERAMNNYRNCDANIYIVSRIMKVHSDCIELGGVLLVISSFHYFRRFLKNVHDKRKKMHPLRRDGHKTAVTNPSTWSPTYRVFRTHGTVKRTPAR